MICNCGKDDVRPASQQPVDKFDSAVCSSFCSLIFSKKKNKLYLLAENDAIFARTGMRKKREYANFCGLPSFCFCREMRVVLGTSQIVRDPIALATNGMLHAPIHIRHTHVPDTAWNAHMPHYLPRLCSF